MAKQSAQRGVIPLIVIFIALVVIGGGIVGVQSGLLKLPTKNTPAPVPQQILKPSLTPQVATKTEGKWQTYSSDKYGYNVTYPVDWTLLDGNTDTSRQMLIKDNANLGYVDIQSFFDKTLAGEGKLQEALNALEQKFKKDQSLKVAQFKSSVEGKVGGYITTGEQTLNGELYNFENRGLLGTSGKILLFHGAYKKTAPSDYLQKIEKIITSFKTD